jgi:streptogramin lyase
MSTTRFTRFGLVRVLLALAFVAFFVLPAVATALPLGSVTKFTTGLEPGAAPNKIASGPDGKLWFTDTGTVKAIGSVDTTGAVVEYPLPNTSELNGITAGPDGNLWFTDSGEANERQEVTIAGATDAVDTFTLGNLPTPACSSASTAAITYSSTSATLNGNIKSALEAKCGAGNVAVTGSPAVVEFTGTLATTNLPQMSCSISGTVGDSCTVTTEKDGDVRSINRITTSGAVTKFGIADNGGNAGSNPQGITTGSDGQLWFADSGTTQAVGSIAPATGTIFEYSVPLPAGVGRIAGGPDGNLWFTDQHQVNEEQRVTIGGATDAVDTFTLGNLPTPQCSAASTAPITYSSTEATLNANIDNALEALCTSENFQVTGSPSVVLFEFGSLSFANVPQMSCSISGTVGDSCTTETVKEGSSGSIDRITPGGSITKFDITAYGGNIGGEAGQIIIGPDGSMWYLDEVSDRLAVGRVRISPSVKISEFAVPGGTLSVRGIAPGPDGNVWYTEFHEPFVSAGVARVTPAGEITEFSEGIGIFSSGLPQGIATGSDGNLWFSTIPFIGGSVDRFGTGAPAASLRAPSVIGTAQVGTQQVCGGDRWADWAGAQPDDGGLLSSSTGPPAVQWLKDGSPIAGATNRTYIPVAGDLGHALSCTESVTYRDALGVTVPVTSATVTVIAQNSGPTGPTGPAGGTGSAGPAGVAGSNGANGKDGAQGPQGAQGPAGPAAKVTCKAKGTKKVRVTCKVTAASASNARLRWSLRRAGRTYRHGTTRGSHLRLQLGNLAKGRYLLHLEGIHGGTVIVVG